jgi:hypothetical protein
MTCKAGRYRSVTPPPLRFSTGRPPKGQEMSAERTSEITAFLLEHYPLFGYRKVVALAENKFQISRSRAERLLRKARNNEPTNRRGKRKRRQLSSRFRLG